MNATDAQQLTLRVDDSHVVSALSLAPPDSVALYVFAHGAGAGMAHASMTGIAQALCEVGIATLRFQFPYMERGSRRPDGPALCHATVRAAVDQAARRWPELPLIAGGRSFGGRMTSQAQAAQPLPGVAGLVFLGFPLHPAGRPGIERAQHLSAVRIPMLFLQGDRDELAQLDLLRPVIDGLGTRATLSVLPEADHSFKVPARSGRTVAAIQRQLAHSVRQWVDSTPGRWQDAPALQRDSDS
jgi:uncharacterized protein